MQNIGWKLVLIFAVLAACALTLSYKKIRLGKDLQGGTSLIYLISIPDEPGIDKQAVLGQTIEVLKNRVNPKGVLDISMQPLGLDRIEIVMPLPSSEVLALRNEFRDRLEALVKDAEIDPEKLDESLRNGTAAADFGRAVQSERAARFVELQQAHNELEAARRAWSAARGEGAAQDQLNRLEDAVARAQVHFDDLRESLLRTSLDQARLLRTLNLSTRRETRKDPATGQPMLDEKGKPLVDRSPREIALENLRAEFPHLAGELDQVVASYDDYQSKRTTLDDPEDLMRLLRGAGVLEFYIAVRESQAEGLNIPELRSQLKERGPQHVDSTVAGWFKINELKQWYKSPQELIELERDPETFFAAGRQLVASRYQSDYYLLLYTTRDKSLRHEAGTAWTLEDARTTRDQWGRPAVSFRLDSAGGQLMSKLTGTNVGQPMAIVLDGEVYSAPNINSQIGNSGIIEGEFTRAELNYLTRVLRAGALQARMSDQPIAINTLGPSLGADNLERGKKAVILSIIGTAALMAGYYFFAGMVANVALLANAIIIFGVMAGIDGTFTLPGLAGIALSIGMAVDANVLIYERVREELMNAGEDVRTAVRLGYQKALSAIVDGNLTNLIVCIVLYYTATTEVKGFALTLSLGIFATLFTALFVTRQIFYLYTDYFKIRRLPMLATVFPAIHKALEPHVDWVKKRYVFLTASALASIASLGLMYWRGSELLDTEFRGGLTMTMQARMAQPGEPADKDTKRLLLSRPAVESEIHAIGEQAPPALLNPVQQLASATVSEQGTAAGPAFTVRVALPEGAERSNSTMKRMAAAIEAGSDPPLHVTTSRFESDAIVLMVAPRLPADTSGDEAPPQMSAQEVESQLRAIAANAPPQVPNPLHQLRNASVLTVGTMTADFQASRFQIKVASPPGASDEETITDQVVKAIADRMGDRIEATPPLDFRGANDPSHAQYTRQVNDATLGAVIGRPEFTQSVARFRGGVAVIVSDIDPPITAASAAERIQHLREKPDFSTARDRKVQVFGLDLADPANPSRGYTSLAVLVVDPALSRQNVDFERWDRELAAVEWTLVSTAFHQGSSMQEISSFSSAVARSLVANAIVAVAVSMLLMLVYIWVRFGSARYSLAATVATVHDVIICLGAIALTHVLAGTTVGRWLLLDEVRIDLNVIAALLTLIGYSLNDTIVILDRVRENRGKRILVTPEIVNTSINQTFSRTILTGGTTFIAVIILYILGGTGIQPFAYTFLVGLLIGTYSSVAIAAPLVVRAEPPAPLGTGMPATVTRQNGVTVAPAIR